LAGSRSHFLGVAELAVVSQVVKVFEAIIKRVVSVERGSLRTGIFWVASLEGA